MNGLSMGEICYLVCCPPCPSEIVAKLAFLPPGPTYKLITNSETSQPPNSPNGQNTTEQTSLQQQQQQQQPQTPASGGANGTQNSKSSSSSFAQLIRNSTRRICSSFVCSQQTQQPNYQQLHTNAKLVLLDKAEWQYGPAE